jgi:transposase
MEAGMSLSLHPSYTVPQETARIVRAVLPPDNFYIRLYDTLGTLFQDSDFAALFPKDGQPALSLVRLMLVSILQYVEGLTDRQAAEAVRTRIDWKYLLCLEIMDVGFDYSVLSEFRTQLIENGWEQKVFAVLLERIRSQGLLKGGGQARTDATLVLGAVRDLSRLEMVGETLRSALNSLSVVAPDWMRAHYQEAWIERYSARVQNYRLPTSQTQRDACAEVIGSDGLVLLLSICTPEAPAWLREVPAARRLHRVWIQNYTWREENQLRWRQANELLTGAAMLSYPYDDVRLNKKRESVRVGYKVHLTETRDEDLPRIITNVETTPATSADGQMTNPIHEALKAKALLPADHIVDTAYLDAELLVTSQQAYSVKLVGPTRPDTAWQARDTPLPSWLASSVKPVWPVWCPERTFDLGDHANWAENPPPG